jgi:hypothetical protein
MMLMLFLDMSFAIGRCEHWASQEAESISIATSLQGHQRGKFFVMSPYSVLVFHVRLQLWGLTRLIDFLKWDDF